MFSVLVLGLLTDAWDASRGNWKMQDRPVDVHDAAGEGKARVQFFYYTEAGPVVEAWSH